MVKGITLEPGSVIRGKRNNESTFRPHAPFLRVTINFLSSCFPLRGYYQAKKEIKECDQIILDQGLAPAPAFPERPEAKREDIPVGARFTDQEIAAHLGTDSAIGLVACSQAMSMSIRDQKERLAAASAVEEAGACRSIITKRQ